MKTLNNMLSEQLKDEEFRVCYYLYYPIYSDFVASLLNSFSFQLVLIDSLVGEVLGANGLTSNGNVVTMRIKMEVLSWRNQQR